MKRTRKPLTRIQREAKGKPCMVRVPGCDGGGDTTVLAHYRLSGLCGTGMKPPDIIGAWCCDPCHSKIDQRAKSDFSRDELRLWFAEGVFRTQAALIATGLLKVV